MESALLFPPWGVLRVTYGKSKTNLKCWDGSMPDATNKKHLKCFFLEKIVLCDSATQIYTKTVLWNIIFGLTDFQKNADTASIQAKATDNQLKFREHFHAMLFQFHG